MGLKGKRNRRSLYYNRSPAAQSSVSLSRQPPASPNRSPVFLFLLLLPPRPSPLPFTTRCAQRKVGRIEEPWLINTRRLRIPREGHFPAPWPGNNAAIQRLNGQPWALVSSLTLSLSLSQVASCHRCTAESVLGRVTDDARPCRVFSEGARLSSEWSTSVCKHRHRRNASVWHWTVDVAFRFAPVYFRFPPLESQLLLVRSIDVGSVFGEVRSSVRRRLIVGLFWRRTPPGNLSNLNVVSNDKVCFLGRVFENLTDSIR